MKEQEMGKLSRNPLLRLHQTLPFMRDEMLYLTTPSPQISRAILHLQSISQSLVHLSDLGGNAEVNGAVTDLDNDATNKVGGNL